MPTDTTTSTATSTAQILKDIQIQAGQSSQNFLSGYFSHLPTLEVISVIISLILLAGIIYIATETGWASLRIERFRDVILKTDLPKKNVQKSWVDIQTHFFKGDDNDLKIAILEADKLLNEALRHAGMLGVQLGDRLKSAKPGQIPNLDEVWQAHKLRNQIAHEPNFKLKRDLAERALSIYKEALQNLGVF